MLSKTVKIAIFAVLAVLLVFLLGGIFSFDVSFLISSWQTYVVIFLYLFWRLVKAVEENRGE
ncbi:hypothetical protein BMS3Abin16_00651 [archaeon BMS3Abin16]|nr:hypothetical protein BMS3Abin16_00651 [archaeon BMS3Abin16]